MVQYNIFWYIKKKKKKHRNDIRRLSNPLRTQIN